MRTVDESVLSLRNDYEEVLRFFNPKIVDIKRVSPPEGCMCKLQVTVHAPTYYLTTPEDITPKPMVDMSFFIDVKDGYPDIKPLTYYGSNCRLASVNVWDNGVQCTDEWLANSSLRSIIDKTVRDIILDPDVTKFDSMANNRIKVWREQMEKDRRIPTINPAMIYKAYLDRTHCPRRVRE